MVQMIRGSEVSRPTPDALTSSVLDHATVTTIANFGLRNKDGMWPSYNCLDLLTPTAMCPEPHVGDKEFQRAEWVPAFEFAVYGGVECSAIGLDKADQQAETRRVFERAEGKGIEAALKAVRFVADEADPARWGAPINIAPGGGSVALPLPVAMALLEGNAAVNYTGVPTLHMPRAAVLMAFGLGLVVERDGKFYTKTGAKVAAGGGYDLNNLSGKWDLYATGEVAIERSEQIDQQVYVIPGDTSLDHGLSENTVISFAERMYRVTIDCYVAHVVATAFTIGD